MDPLITITETPSLLAPVMTFHYDDGRFDGAWSRPNVSALVFSDSRFADSVGTVVPAFAFGYRGGPFGARSMPVQLIFWGDWWQTPAGRERAGWVESSTRALLASHYVDELRQYSIDPPRVFRGSIFVVAPGPPGDVSAANAAHAVADLVDALIEQDEFPDPDEGPRIAFIACLPPGFKDMDSWHLSDREYDPPFDVDEVWYGYVRHYDENSENVDNMMREISELIVGIATDPEADGWRVDPTGNRTIVELTGVAISTINGRLVAQAGYVNGVKAAPYWSNRHLATILPIDTDYGARLSGTVMERGDREVLAEGTFRPDPSDSTACSTELPECCIEDRDYVWTVFGVDEEASVELSTERFHTPVASWTINGRPVTASGFITLDVIIDKFKEQETVSIPGSVTLEYIAEPTVLTMRSTNAEGNFDVAVGCTVVDSAITGNLTTNVVATPTVGVGFVGAVLEVEKDYVEQRGDCYRAMLRKFNHLKIPVGPEDKEGIDFQPGVDVLVIPAYARYEGAAQLQLAKKLVRAANALLEPEVAKQFIENLVASTPVLAGGLFRQKIFRPKRQSTVM